MKNQTIKSLYESIKIDLMACNSDFERSMVKAITGKQIRELAIDLMGKGKLTSSDASIAGMFGFKGASHG